MQQHTAEEVATWLFSAPVGAKFVYHIGTLLYDRAAKISGAPVYPYLDELATLLHAEELVGNAHLLQRRVQKDTELFEYIVVKKEPSYADKCRYQEAMASASMCGAGSPEETVH